MKFILISSFIALSLSFFEVSFAHPCFNNAVTNSGPAPVGSKCQLEWRFNGTTFYSCGAHSSSIKPYLPDGILPPGVDRWCSLVPDYDTNDPKKRTQYGFCDCPPSAVCGGVLNIACAGPGEYCRYAADAGPQDTGVCSTQVCGIRGCNVFYDGCNDCVCNSDGTHSCTKKSCKVRGAARCKSPSVSCPKGCQSWFDGCNICECAPNGLIDHCTDKACDKNGKAECKAPFVECTSGTANACPNGFSCITPSGSAPGSKGVCVAQLQCADEKNKLKSANQQFIAYAVNYYKNILNVDEQIAMMDMLHAQ